MWKQSDYGLTPYWAAFVENQCGKDPDVDTCNRVPGMVQATRWVSRLNTDDESGMTSEEESVHERVRNHLVCVRTLTYQASHKKLLAPHTLEPTPEDFQAQECVRSCIAKLKKSCWAVGATTMKRYQKTNCAERLFLH